MNLTNKEVLKLLRIGLEDETDLPVDVQPESPFIADVAQAAASTGDEAQESTKKHALRTETPNGLRRPETGGDSRDGQFISLTDRGLLLLALSPV